MSFTIFISIDDDVVELSNLQRQTLFTTADIGRRKATVAAERLRALNPEICVSAVTERLDAANAATQRKLAEADAGLDARAEAAAQALGAQRKAAVAELDKVAAEAAADLVKRVSGLEVSSAEAAKAVGKVAA